MTGWERVLEHAAANGYRLEETDYLNRLYLVRGTYRVWVKISTRGAIIAAMGNHGPWVLDSGSDRAARLIRLLPKGA